MRLDYVTIFPDYFSALKLSLVGKALESGIISVGVHDLRDWTDDVHRSVDDTPFGGGAGMVMMPEPWGRVLDELFGVGTQGTCLVIPTPSGVPFTQAQAQELSSYEHLVFACGRYEGIDARVAQYARGFVEVREVSLGDYVLNGGEAAALAMTEAIVRLLPGVVGNPESLEEESHSPGLDSLLEYPVYTKPSSWRGIDVPDVLLSGHHAKIAAWRRDQAEQITELRRQ
ncbi:MAG: tRNA (guanosine(37)-N1)-methyltransferase TrmD [Propionibacteriaceae bacterium]|nr:tRNA (guanosine(37)-N1)-methyltransferase TrmD [Propionibacteriaceae bacterium]